MSIVYTWGSPLPETNRAEVNMDTTIMFDQQWSEVQYQLTFTPSNPTTYDYQRVVEQFVYDFEGTNPEVEIKYVQATEGSPHIIRIQFIHHGSSLTLSIIAGLLLTALGYVLTHIVGIAIATAIILAGVALYKRFAPNTYQCPICGQTYNQYEILVAHMQAEHPTAPIPDRPIEMPMWVVPVLVGVVAVVAIVVIGPKIGRSSPKRRELSEA